MSSESKPARAVSDIQVEYQNLCTRAGHLQYQIETLKNDLNLLNSTLRDLNLEAVASKKAEDAAKDKAKEQEDAS